jgi:hypothetical protein
MLAPAAQAQPLSQTWFQWEFIVHTMGAIPNDTTDHTCLIYVLGALFAVQLIAYGTKWSD